MRNVIGRGKPKPWRSFVTEESREDATPEALDLIDRCIRYDHTERITAAEALEHPYFARAKLMPCA